jgi:hypothetical protein
MPEQEVDRPLRRAMVNSRAFAGHPSRSNKGLLSTLFVFFRCKRGDDFLEARIAAERVPEGQQF